MKTCCRCRVHKELCEFYANRRKKDGVNDYCKKCHKEYVAQHYRDNKKDYITRGQKRREISKRFMQELKSSLKCERCPENDPCCLDFHHTNPEQKEFSVSVLVAGGYSIARIKREVKRCKVLCSNCHRKLHHYNN